MKIFITAVIFFTLGIFAGSWLEHNTFLQPRADVTGYTIPDLTKDGWGMKMDSWGHICYTKPGFRLYIQ